jgi:ketosteroid isomerase-like protein
LAEAAANFRSGDVRFETVSRYDTPDLAYVVQLEPHQLVLRGSEAAKPISQTLRVTLIFRREGDEWKICHRHADTVTAPRSISSIIEQ